MGKGLHVDDGMRQDLSVPQGPYNTDAEAYHRLNFSTFRAETQRMFQSVRQRRALPF